MPYQLDRGTTPIEGLIGLAATVAGINFQNKQAEAVQQRQAEIDKQNAVLAAAQIGNYQSEAEKNKAQIGVDQSTIKKNAAYNRTLGLDANGNPLNVNTSGIELQPGNKGKKTPVTLAQQYAATLTAYQRYAKQGVNDQHNPCFSNLVALRGLMMQHQKDQDAALAEVQRQKDRIELKKTIPGKAPSSARGRSTQSVDADAAAYAESEISKSPNPLATAAHIAAIAVTHGASPKTVQVIRDYGTYYSGKKNTPLRTNAASSPFGNA